MRGADAADYASDWCSRIVRVADAADYAGDVGSRIMRVADAAENRWRGWWNKWELRKQPDQ